MTNTPRPQHWNWELFAELENEWRNATEPPRTREMLASALECSEATVRGLGQPGANPRWSLGARICRFFNRHPDAFTTEDSTT